VAPAQTLTDREYQRLRDASIAVLRKIGVDTGGSNVQFAVNPDDGRVLVIEMNPRVSRSSALASKATGSPSPRSPPSSRWATRSMSSRTRSRGRHAGVLRADHRLRGHQDPALHLREVPGRQHPSHHPDEVVGEAMAIGRSFQESFQKALRSLELGYDGFDEQLTLPLNEEASDRLSYELRWPARPILYVADAFRAGWTLEQAFDATKIDPWFLSQIEDLVREEARLREEGFDSLELPRLRSLKRKGFSDARIGHLVARQEHDVRSRRRKLGLHRSTSAWTPAPQSSRPRRPICTRPTRGMRGQSHTRRKIMILAAAPTASARGSSSITAACTRPWRSPRTASRPSW